MSIVISPVPICNMALTQLKMGPITSLDPPDSTESARALYRIYDMARDTALAGKDWGFARVKAALTEIDMSAEDPVPGWTYVYSYPVKCLCERKIFVDIESLNPAAIEFETLYLPSISKKVICCNEEDAYIAYTYQLIDPAFYSMPFITALSFLLAAMVAKPLTGDDEIGQLMMRMYMSLVSDAARISDIGKFIKPNQVSSFEDAR